MAEGADRRMTGKVIGACLILAGCGGFGLALTASFRREEAALRQLVSVLDYMQCELQYRLTALPDLCRQAGELGKNPVCQFFGCLANELDRQIAPDVSSCIRLVMNQIDAISPKAEKGIWMLGTTLGRFDLEGQLQGLEAARSYCRSQLNNMEQNRDNRLRSYQTLSLCAGAALAILFV